MSDNSEAGRSPRHALLVFEAARLYFEQELSQVAIAHRLDVSRFKVARLLKEAKDQKIVRISLHEPPGVAVVQSRSLKSKWGLQDAIVIPAQPTDELSSIRHSLAAAAADLIMETMEASDTLGMVCGRMVNDAARMITRLPACTLVQMTGVDGSGSMLDSPIVSLQQVAALSRGRAFPIYSPMLLRDSRLVRGLKMEPGIAGAFERFPEVTHALIAVGAWAPGESSLYDACNRAEQRELADRGVVAEVSGHLFDAEGHVIATDFSRRCLGISLQELAQIPNLITVAGGVTRVEAIRAVLRGGHVRSLLTDSTTAADLL